MWDTNVATFGRDPLTGFARRSLDNVGVQYGLEALNRGTITTAEFLDLNDKIGGFDNDGHVRPRAQRRRSRIAAADLCGRPAEFRRRRPRRRRRSCTSAATTIAIGDIHDRFRDFTVRERLRKTNGRVDNQVIWVYPNGVARPRPEGRRRCAIDTMSQWLDAIAKDTSSPAGDREDQEGEAGDGGRRLLGRRGHPHRRSRDVRRPRPLQHALPESQEPAARRRHRRSPTTSPSAS